MDRGHRVRSERQQRKKSREERAAQTVGHPVSAEEVEAARLAYVEKIQFAQVQRNRGEEEGSQRVDWAEATQRTLKEANIERLIYEGLRDRRAEQEQEKQVAAANQLAATNTDLAGKQMWLAAAIVVLTAAQVFLGVLNYLAGNK